MCKLIVAAELARMSQDELVDLLHDVLAHLPQTEAGSAGRRNSLASLENIARAIHENGWGPYLTE